MLIDRSKLVLCFVHQKCRCCVYGEMHYINVTYYYAYFLSSYVKMNHSFFKVTLLRLCIRRWGNTDALLLKLPLMLFIEHAFHFHALSCDESKVIASSSGYDFHLMLLGVFFRCGSRRVISTSPRCPRASRCRSLRTARWAKRGRCWGELAAPTLLIFFKKFSI